MEPANKKQKTEVKWWMSDWDVDKLSLEDQLEFLIVRKQERDREAVDTYGKRWKPNMISELSIQNSVGALTRWLNSGLYLEYDDRAFDMACLHKSYDSVKWWLEKAFEAGSSGHSTALLYSHRAVDSLCANGELDMLVFVNNSLKRMDLEFKYSVNAFNQACTNGHTDIMNWLLKNYPLKYTIVGIDMASANGHTNCLQWFIDHNIPMKFSEYAIDHASGNGKINSLNWWLQYYKSQPGGSQPDYIYCKTYHVISVVVPKAKYTEKALNLATKNNHAEVLEWWFVNKANDTPYKNESPFVFLHDEKVIEAAAGSGSEKSFKWWEKKIKEKKININVYMTSVIEKASSNGCINILQMLFDSDVKFHYFYGCLTDACGRGEVSVLQWFKDNSYVGSRLTFKYNPNFLFFAIDGRRLNVIEWFKQNGVFVPIKSEQEVGIDTGSMDTNPNYFGIPYQFTDENDNLTMKVYFTPRIIKLAKEKFPVALDYFPVMKD
jgi:ankyrin repeat protein